MDALTRRLLDDARTGAVTQVDDELPAALLLRILAGAVDEAVDPRGVRVRGARITGPVDWDWQRLTVPLELIGCEVDEVVSLRQAHVAELTFQDCRLTGFAGEMLAGDSHVRFEGTDLTGPVNLHGATLRGSLIATGATFRGDGDEPALDGARLQTGGGVVLDRGFLALGTVVLRAAKIDGTVYLTGGRLENPDGQALHADNITIGGNLIMTDGFTAVGRVKFTEGRVAGTMDCGGAIFRNPGGDALWFSGTQVGGALAMNGGFRSEGRVRMNGVTLHGYLACGGATFSNPGAIAISAHNATIGSYVDFAGVETRPPSTVQGGVSLLGSRIHGSLILDRLRCDNADGTALDLRDVHVDGNVRMGNGFHCTSQIRFGAARVDGDLRCQDATMEGSPGAFSGTGMTVLGSFRLRRASVTGRVDLRSAEVGELDDDAGSWPPAGSLLLAGFRYGRLSDRAMRRPEERIGWIRRQRDYAPEPYQHLAQVFRNRGQEAEATQVAMAQQDDLITRGDLSRPMRVWHRFLGLTIGHGYRPGRAAWMLLALYVITAVTVLIGARNDAFIQVGDSAPKPGVTSSRCTDDYPCFSAMAYALENITPFINLHQSENWHPKSSEPLELALRDWLYLCTVLGYAGTTLLAAGLSGLARNPQPPP